MGIIVGETDTLKEHTSYSEFKIWKDCGWKHKNIYIDKVDIDLEESPHLHYGGIIHEASENFIKTRKMDILHALEQIKEKWNLCNFDSKNYIEKQTNIAISQGWNYKHYYVKDWLDWAKTCLSYLPTFMDNEFPNWEYCAAEEKIYENIENKNIKFKGYIDCIIKVPVNNGKKYKYYIIDWKTASARGWSKDKKNDFITKAQLILYKYYWSKKNNIKENNVMCCFVLLKKIKNPEKSCQIIKVPSGPKSLEKANKLINNMIFAINKKIYLKNKNSCKFCEFNKTKYCK